MIYSRKMKVESDLWAEKIYFMKRPYKKKKPKYMESFNSPVNFEKSNSGFTALS